MPRLIQVIESEVSRGGGTGKDDPCRAVMQYYTVDGEFLAERDTWLELNTKRVPYKENDACETPRAQGR